MVLIAKKNRLGPYSHQPEFAACASITLLSVLRESLEHAYLGHAINPDTGLIANYKTLRKVRRVSFAKKDEFGRLLQGNGTTTTTCTNTMKFIDPNDLPSNVQCTYLSLVCAYCPEKENPYWVRGVVGFDRLSYDRDCSTKTAAIYTVKLHFNHIISTPNGRHDTTDVKDFYLNTSMERKIGYTYVFSKQREIGCGGPNSIQVRSRKIIVLDEIILTGHEFNGQRIGKAYGRGK